MGTAKRTDFVYPNERVVMPTPKQSDMERQLRMLLTWNECRLLTMELAGSDARDGRIAALIAEALREKSR